MITPLFRNEESGLSMVHDISYSGLLVDLAEKIFVVATLSYLVMHSRHISGIWEGRKKTRNLIFPILLFGAFSIFGTYSGAILPNGSIVNIRDLGPMMGGLLCGPLVGVGAGVLGGVHRLLMGGENALPLCLATILAGLFAGLLHRWKKGRFIGVFRATFFAAAMEEIHIGILLLMARPFSKALDIALLAGPPLIVINALGMMVFSLIVRNIIRDRKTEEEKSLLNSELKRKNHDMEIAREIQKSFLPKEIPELEGYEMAATTRPAREVGGDFYDFFPLSNTASGFLVADVSGKGIPAALFMALSKILVRVCTSVESRPFAAIQLANEEICQYADSGMFVSLVYCILFHRERRLVYCNAGHNPGFLFRAESGEITWLRSSGPFVGLLEEIRLSDGSEILHPGDILVLYTDGVTEAHNMEGEMFGEKRLISLIREGGNLSAWEIKERILGEVETFTGDQPAFDDITLLVMKLI